MRKYVFAMMLLTGCPGSEEAAKETVNPAPAPEVVVATPHAVATSLVIVTPRPSVVVLPEQKIELAKPSPSSVPAVH